MIRRFKINIYAIISLFLIICSGVYAQHIAGKITDQITGKPIKNAEIYSSNGGLLAITKADGSYISKKLSADTYKITVFSYEFQLLEKTVILTRDKNSVVDIKLVPLKEQLSEVLIQKRRRKVFALRRLKAVEGTAIYAGKKTEVVLLDQVLGNKSSNNARQIYSQVVGLNIYENDDAGLQLNIGGRGLDPNRTANFNTRQNDYDISAEVLGYPESYYTPPAEALSEIQIVRGAASLQYGTQFGGLLNFKFKKPNPYKTFSLISRQSLGSFGVFTSFNSFSGTVDKTGYYAYFDYKKGNGFRPNSQFDAKNGYVHLTHHFDKKTSVTLEYTYLNYLAQQPGGLTDDQFNRDPKFSNRKRNWFGVNWNLWAIKFEHQLSKKTKMSLNIFGLNASRKTVGFRGNPKYVINPVTAGDEIKRGKYEVTRDLIVGKFRNWAGEFRILSNYKLRRRESTFLLGVKYYKSKNTSRQGAGSNQTDADFNFYNQQFPSYFNQSDFVYPNENIAVFGENIFRLSRKITLTPGIRLEYINTKIRGDYVNILRDGSGNPLPGGTSNLNDNRVKKRSFVLLGVGLSYKPSSYFEGYANISQNYRSVTFSDIRTVNPSFVIDENITDEKGGTADFGIRGRWKNYLSYDIGGFGLFYNDRIGIILDTDGSFSNKGGLVRTNVGDAFIFGFESLVDYNLLSLFDKPTKQFSLNSFVNLSLTRSEYIKSKSPGIKGRKVEFIPLVNLKTGLKFGYKNFWSSLQFTYLSKQYTDASNAEIPDKSNLRAGTIGPIPAYSIMDLSFSYRYKRWTLETGINNALNEKYFTRRATGYPGPGIIPSISRNYYLTLQFKL